MKTKSKSNEGRETERTYKDTDVVTDAGSLRLCCCHLLAEAGQLHQLPLCSYAILLQLFGALQRLLPPIKGTAEEKIETHTPFIFNIDMSERGLSRNT